MGNYLATKAIGRFGVDRAILVSLFFLIAGIGMFGVFFGNYILACVSCFVWGLGTFSSNSLQQSRLVGIAPALAAATVALNTSAVYLGQSVGAATGGFAIKDGVSANVVWMALGLSCAGGRHVGCRNKACSQGITIGGNGMGQFPVSCGHLGYHGCKAWAFRQT